MSSHPSPSLAEYFDLLPHPAAIISHIPPRIVYTNSSFPSDIIDRILSHIDTPEFTLASPSNPSGWVWKVRCLRNDTLAIEGTPITPTPTSLSGFDLRTHPYPTTPHLEISPLSISLSTPLLLPTPTNPTPFSHRYGPDLTSYPLPSLQHNQLFLSLPWATNPLGPISTWSSQLRGVVQTMMASPFPVLLSYGPEYVLLYNEAYSRVIGAKHPRILGMRYGEAWPEVWGALEGVVQAGYRGSILNVECQEMFLLRGERLEETYFSYSLIPLRDANNETCGLYIPNFDNTVRIITERRIRSLHEISRSIAAGRTHESLVKGALHAMRESNSRDMHFALLYVAENADPVDIDGSDRVGSGSASGSVGPIAWRRSLTNETADSIEGTRTIFRLAGRYGIKDGFPDSIIPMEIISGEDDETADAAIPNTITRYIRQVKEQGTTLPIDLTTIPGFATLLNGNPFPDAPGSGIILPIRSSSEDRLHGVLVLGLSTRQPWDEAYSNYIHLVRGLLATGLATIKLHTEDLLKARYMAALNRLKNEELQSLLKQRTDELRSSELKFSSAFSVSPAAIWIGSKEGEIWDVNRAYYELSGLAEDAELDEWINRVHPEDIEHMRRLFIKCLTERVLCEFRFLPTDEEVAAGITEKWIEGSAGPVLGDTGEVVMVTGTLVDVTIRRNHILAQTRRADEAMELKRLQDHFIDMLSHELRNPLSAICLSSDGVVESLRTLATRCPDDVAKELAEIVNDAGVINLCTVHMRRLVDDVLALSKLDSNLLVVTPTFCQPEAFCAEVLDMLQTEMLANDIDCKFEIKEGYKQHHIDWVYVDPSRINQILINLITNAIKFTSTSETRLITLSIDATVTPPVLPGWHITEQSDTPLVTGRRESATTYLVFDVTDTGAGMGDEESKRLFQRFSQGTNRTHLTFGGSGLGLFICRRITNLLGGEISVSSELGKGSTFSFFIPVNTCEPPVDARRRSSQPHHPAIERPPITPGYHDRSAASTPLPQAKRSKSNEQALCVLLAEDNEISQKLLRKQLIRAGLKVAIANDGVEALEYVLGSGASVEGGPNIDIILMDIEMPRKGGVETTLEIRGMESDGRLRHRTPIIAVSANARTGQIQTMLDAGMDAAVSKPFKMKELLEQIEMLTQST